MPVVYFSLIYIGDQVYSPETIARGGLINERKTTAIKGQGFPGSVGVMSSLLTQFDPRVMNKSHWVLIRANILVAGGFVHTKD